MHYPELQCRFHRKRVIISPPFQESLVRPVRFPLGPEQFVLGRHLERFGHHLALKAGHQSRMHNWNDRMWKSNIIVSSLLISYCFCQGYADIHSSKRKSCRKYSYCAFKNSKSNTYTLYTLRQKKLEKKSN